MIKAIETKYNGYSFRSRTEAKWAYVFDKLNIKYLYENEGYELENGDWYLPDFYLPNHGFFIHWSVKPQSLARGYKRLILMLNYF